MGIGVPIKLRWEARRARAEAAMGKSRLPAFLQLFFAGGNKYGKNVAPPKSLYREQPAAPGRKMGSAKGVYAKAMELCTLKLNVMVCRLSYPVKKKKKGCTRKENTPRDSVLHTQRRKREV